VSCGSSDGGPPAPATCCVASSAADPDFTSACPGAVPVSERCGLHSCP
jgi:hypothetical protein